MHTPVLLKDPRQSQVFDATDRWNGLSQTSQMPLVFVWLEVHAEQFLGQQVSLSELVFKGEVHVQVFFESFI